MSRLPVPGQLGPVDYASATPPAEYHCGKCGVLGVKLWRDYNTFLVYQSLLCASCACAEQSKETGAKFTVIEREGCPGKVSVVRDPDPSGLGAYGDQIGWRVPAVPTEDGSTYWGYSSVPDDGCAWWYRLPLTRGAKP